MTSAPKAPSAGRVVREPLSFSDWIVTAPFVNVVVGEAVGLTAIHGHPPSRQEQIGGPPCRDEGGARWNGAADRWNPSGCPGDAAGNPVRLRADEGGRGTAGRHRNGPPDPPRPPAPPLKDAGPEGRVESRASRGSGRNAQGPRSRLATDDGGGPFPSRFQSARPPAPPGQIGAPKPDRACGSAGCGGGAGPSSAAGRPAPSSSGTSASRSGRPAGKRLSGFSAAPSRPLTHGGPKGGGVASFAQGGRPFSGRGSPASLPDRGSQDPGLHSAGQEEGRGDSCRPGRSGPLAHR